MCVCEHYPTLCVSSAASFSQFATSRSWASTFFGSFCASDVGNDDDDGGEGGDCFAGAHVCLLRSQEISRYRYQAQNISVTAI